MIEEEHFIIKTDETEVEEGIPTTSESTSSFPVKTQLFLVGIILMSLFAGYIVPKTVSLLNFKTKQTEVQLSSLQATQDAGAIIPETITEININAQAAYVWDIVGQRALFEKNPDQELPLASITKLMTALVAYELVPDNTLVTISNAAAAQQSGGNLAAGEIYKVKDLADFALISSHNSAAYTLAGSVGELLGEEDTVSQFIAAMNIRADELNLSSLDYSNPTGLDISATEAGATGSARDTTFLMEYILLNNPEILTPTVKPYTRLYNQNGDYHDAQNTNNILTEVPNLLGSKTGYTDLAGGNLTIAFDAGYNRPVIITVLGSTRNERFDDVKKLIVGVQQIMTPKN